MPFLLLMPSYNQARFIAEAVDSVLAQDDPDWELWILDNSTDGTPEVMARYADPRIRFTHIPARMDPGTCLNRMLAEAKGEHFSYIHTDNRLLPNFVSAHRRALKAHPMAVAYSDYWEIDEAGRRTKVRRRPRAMSLPRLFSTDTIGVPFAATTALAERLGGFTADDLADDVLFVMRADVHGPRVHLSDLTMEYRAHGGSRFLQSGDFGVARAVLKSAVKAYGERPAGAPDPFLGGDLAATRHAARAGRMARMMAASLLSGLGPGEVWIEGTGPASFWLAWACTREGRRPEGFVDGKEGRLLGLPVRTAAHLPAGAHRLAPRARAGLRGPGLGLNLRWLLAGLPPMDHPLKRLPGAVLFGLLCPYLVHGVEGEIALRGEGPLAAYLAYGAERVAGMKVAGLLGAPLLGLPPVPDSEGGTVWVVPGADGPGLRWELRRA
jgi:hypothetical protein